MPSGEEQSQRGTANLAVSQVGELSSGGASPGGAFVSSAAWFTLRRSFHFSAACPLVELVYSSVLLCDSNYCYVLVFVSVWWLLVKGYIKGEYY